MFTFVSMPDIDQTYMHRCIELARFGLGSTAPNPMVGAVVTCNDRIIGEGWHRACGEPHAEVNAIGMVADGSLLQESTLYVNLEPCNHHGRTPPCTDLILKSGIRRVVIGQADPNPTVAGGGIRRLRENGVEVILGVMEEESRWVNRRFNTFHKEKRPYLVLKWAQTADGYIDNRTEELRGEAPVWITDETCRRLVHKWRTEEPAILAGSRTILLDNPQLNVRAWAGKDPIRITIDRKNNLKNNKPQTYLTPGSPFLLLDHSIPTLIFTTISQPEEQNLEYIRINPGEQLWPQVLDELYRREIQSVLIEGGPTLLETLISNNLWDEARVFIGPAWFGRGTNAPDFPAQPAEKQRVGNSELLLFRKP